MANPKLLSLIQSETHDDPDVFIRMVNDRSEQLRREQRLAAEREREEAEHNKECALCIVFGAALAFLITSILSILL